MKKLEVQKVATPKKAYQQPTLSELGSIATITLGNNGSTIDGNCTDADQNGDPSQNCQ